MSTNTNICPNCGYETVEGESVDVGEYGASQDCNCPNCGATWILTFTCTGYEFLETGEPA